MPYLVDRDALFDSLGSQNAALLRELIDEHEERMEEIDKGFERGAPGVAEALRDLIEGRAPERHATPYHYAYELLCQRFGTLLDNAAWYPCDWGFVEELDRKLADQDVPLSVRGLLDGGSPFALPRPRDFPAVGHVTPEDARLGRRALEMVRREALAPEERRALSELESWLAESATQNRLLVLYYY